MFEVIFTTSMVGLLYYDFFVVGVRKWDWVPPLFWIGTLVFFTALSSIYLDVTRKIFETIVPESYQGPLMVWSMFGAPLWLQALIARLFCLFFEAMRRFNKNND
ncbi:MAG: hypothetical protein ACRCU5_12195 [Rhizobiaceae bacterium]